MATGLQKNGLAIELQCRDSTWNSIDINTPSCRSPSSLTKSINDVYALMEHNFVIVGDPGIIFAPMLNQLGAYVQAVDLSRATVHITPGMRLIQVNQTKVMDMQFIDILKIYSEAVKSENPMKLRLLDAPTEKASENDLSKCTDVAEALTWKTKMEDEHWNHSLKARAVVLVDGLRFQIFIILVIFFDLAIFFIELYNSVVPMWLKICSWIVMSIYVMEISVRIYGYGVNMYFRKKFCVFDFVVVVMCLVMQILEEASWFVALRGLRVGKVLLVIRAGARLFTGVRSHIPIAVRYKVRMNKMQFRGEFNLDLCYITKRIISMSVPSEGRESMYRNPIDKVVTFFEKMHKDKYMIYDLCEERTYDYSKFHGRVQPFKFTDHSVPTITKMLNFCRSVESWMEDDPENVIAVHCKGGKGRTGTMVCAWLLYCYRNCSAQEAIDFFGRMRTNKAAGSMYQGIETCSQVRYVYYFWDFLHLHKANTLIFKSPFGFNIMSIRLGPFYDKSLTLFKKFEMEIFERLEINKIEDKATLMTNLDEGDSKNQKAWPSINRVSVIAMEFFAEHQERKVEFNSISSKFIKEGRENNAQNQFHLVLEPKNKYELLKGNLRLDLFGIHKKKLTDKLKRKRLLSFWICCDLHPLPPTDKPLVFKKIELDQMQKDANNQKFPGDFQVELNLCLSNSVADLEYVETKNEVIQLEEVSSGGGVSTFWQIGAEQKPQLEVLEDESDEV